MNNTDLISRSALQKHILNLTGMFTDELGFAFSLDAVASAIEAAPAVDAEPVRHGRWKNSKPIYASLNCHFECSACNKAFSAFYSGIGELFNYCPHCGAKMMDGDADGFV